MTVSSKDDFVPWQNPASRRRYRRWAVDLPVYVDVDGDPHYCLLFDISPGGARLRVIDGATPPVDTEVFVDLEGYGQIPAVVRHSAANIIGLMFLHDEADQVRLARWLIQAKPTRRQARHPCRIDATVRFGERELACVVTDLSRSGAAIQIEEAGQFVPSSEVKLLLPGYQPITASVRHVVGDTVGLMLIDGFHGELPNADASPPPSSRKAGGWT